MDVESWMSIIAFMFLAYVVWSSCMKDKSNQK